MYRKPWEAKSQEEFLQLSYEWNKNRVGLRDRYVYLGGRKWSLMREHVNPIEQYCHWLYKLGRDYQLLSIHYSEFKNILFNTNPLYNYGVYREPYISRWSTAFMFSEENYRRQHKFKQKKNKKIEKKQKDLIKLDWHDNKNFLKNRRRKRWSSKSHTYSKQLNRSKIRRWQRDLLKQGRYDQFDNKRKESRRGHWWD